MHEAAQHAGDRDDADRIARVAARFADESLGVGLTLDRITQAGTEGLRRARDAGPNTGATLDAAIERAIRREVPEKHQGLVWKLAFQHEARAGAFRLDVEELVAAGQLGLIRAAALYDPCRGVRFSTYAVHWIRQSLARHVEEHGHTIAVPSYLRQVRRRRDAGGKLTRREAENLHAAELILDRPIVRETNGTFPQSRGFAEIVAPAENPPTELEFRLSQILDLLPEPQRVLVLAYHGIGRERQTLEAIGLEHRVSKQTVKNRLGAAYLKLRKKVQKLGITYEDCLAS